MSTTVIPLDELTQKKNQPTEKVKPKYSTTKSKNKDHMRPIQESDIDMENLPVIQGSFEITKTDADIAQKRSDSNLRPTSSISTTSTLKPFFISPASIKIKSNEKQSTANIKLDSHENILEKFLQHQLQQQSQSTVTAKIEKTNKKGETTVTKNKISTTTLKAPVKVDSSTSITTIASSSTSEVSSTSTFASIDRIDEGIYSDEFEDPKDQEIPKLDVSLFTSAPILEKSPWKPINPLPSQIKQNFAQSDVSSTSTSSSITSTTEEDSSLSPVHRSPFNPPSPIETIMYRNKFVDPDNVRLASSENTNSSSKYYQSFTNPKFSINDYVIERLGIADVRPYPLPVNKIDLQENFSETSNSTTDDSVKVKVDYDEDKFEHLGGGVIAKKPELSTKFMNDTTVENLKEQNEGEIDSEEEDGNEELENEALDEKDSNMTVVDMLTTIFPPTKLGDLFLELLEADKNDTITNDFVNDKIESRISPDEEDSSENITSSTEKLNFFNIKDYIVSHSRNKTNNSSNNGENKVTTVKVPTITSSDIETAKYTPVTSEIPLFPSISKWEFVNGTKPNASEFGITRKVYNETLQAVIVENSQNPINDMKIEELKSNKTNLQQLSSIFDTLAAKLGIKPDVSSKAPPFSQHSQNKLKNSSRTRTPVTKNVTNATPTSTTTQKVTTVADQNDEIIENSSTYRTLNSNKIIRKENVETSSEAVVGQAEVEAIDPTQYDEMLSSIAAKPLQPTTQKTPALVTLLPVKSNSGIRNFNPRLKIPFRNSPTYFISSDPKNMETVVKTSMSFDA